MGINYAPEPTGIAPYTTGLAAGLTKRGHDVRVFTGQPHYPQWKRDEASCGFRSEEEIDGVRVRRLSHHVPSEVTWMGRAAMELTFGLQLLTTRWGGPEVVVCVTPPLLAVAMSAARARLTWRRPAVGIVVHDLYSRGVAETAAVSGLSARAVGVVESAAIRLADGVAVIHAGFTCELADQLGVDVRRIREIRNWNHVDPPDPAVSAAFRNAHGWGADEVVVLHAGNMGYKQGLENVITAAALGARSAGRVRFVLLGDGNQRASLEAAGAGIPTLEFLPLVGDEQFPAALGAADVLLVNERPGVAQMAVPSKLTSYFRAGKPILAATDAAGFTAGELAASGAGVCVPAGRPDLLLSEALRLGTDRALGEQMGEAGRRYCATLLSEEAALDRYEEWVIELAGIRGAGHRVRHPRPPASIRTSGRVSKVLPAQPLSGLRHRGAVIVPAYNEAAVIKRTLLPLSQAAVGGFIELIVVPNGCTDNTAEVSRTVPGVRVVVLEQGSKTAALNAGDDAATLWPRLYLDADIQISAASVLAVLDRLAQGDVLAARPEARYDSDGASAVVRSYYRARGRMPQHKLAMWGAGVYGLSAKGHQRFGAFPTVTGDDYFIDTQFDADEKTVVATVPSVVKTPADAKSLLAIVRRSHRGTAELSADSSALNSRASNTGRHTAIAVVRTIHGPRSAVDAVVYLGMALAKRWPTRQAQVWERDDSSRLND